MINIVHKLWNDEAGFIISAELVLVATIGVLSLVVGLSELVLNISSELEDLGSAFASINQSFSLSGLLGHSSSTSASGNIDLLDFCGGQNDVTPNTNGLLGLGL